jgi:ABC-type nitrate/sulfonate/bicarbonate transport system permease component
MSLRIGRVRDAVTPLLIPVGLLLAWEASARAGVLPIYLSWPTAILGAMVGDAAELGLDLLISLYRAYAGFAIGAGLGVIVGLAAGLNRGVRQFFDPLVAFLYPVPKIAFLPVFLLLLGLGDGSKIAMIAMSVFFPVFLSAQLGLRSVNTVYLWSARSMGAGTLTMFFRVVMPASAPALFDGLRIGLGHSFVLLFAAELIGASSGLGYYISEGEENVRFDMMFAGIVSFAVVGFASDRLFMLVRRRVLRGMSIGTEGAHRR